MSNLIKEYKQANKFERKYFWISLLMISSSGRYSVYNLAISSNPTISIINAFLLLSLTFYGRHLVFQNLEEQEMQWKGLIYDPLTNKMVDFNV